VRQLPDGSAEAADTLAATAADAAHAYVEVLAAAAPRLLTHVALSLVLGAAGWRLWVLPRSRLARQTDADALARVRSAVALAGMLGAAVGLGAGVWALAVQLAPLTDPADGAGAAFGLLTGVVGRTHWGRVWLAHMVALAVAVLGAAVARRRERAVPIGGRAMPDAGAWRTAWGTVALAGVAAGALHGALGHAATPGPHVASALVLAALHVIGAATWVGTLAVLLGAWRVLAGPSARVDAGAPADRGARPRTAAPALVAPQLVAFFPLALTAAGVTALTGAGNGWLRLAGAHGADAGGVGAGAVARVAALPGSAYGRLLIVKLACVAVVAAAGAINAWVHAGRARGRAVAAPDVAALNRTARLELLAALGVFALSAALAVSSPPGGE
jgi:putative copper export protein